LNIAARIYAGVRKLLICAMVSNTLASQTPTQLPHFVRQFSSAQDVRRAHPVMDRTVDIIAGLKADEQHHDFLQAPYAITTDIRGRVFVTDTDAAKVHVFDFAHSKYSSLLGSGERLRRPVGVATDQEGNVYVSDADSREILVYDLKDKFRHPLKKRKGVESYFEAPWGIAIDSATQRIYVCDTARHMVIGLDKKGRVLERFGIRGGGTKPGEFRRPTQVVAAGGEIFVLDLGNSRVQIFNLRERSWREITAVDADMRSGLAVDKHGNIYVSDTGLNRISVFNHEGRFLYIFGQYGTKPGEFNGVSGLWVDSGQCLYAVDAQNKRIQVFSTQQSGLAGNCGNSQ
jgi:DNA-binding beta-propeller fold protein YncE